MVAVDTNILVYAHRRDAPQSDAARKRLTELVENGNDWAVPWPCVHEFLGTVTRARVFRTPSTTEQALDQMEAWMESPTLRLLGEPVGHWSRLRRILLAGAVVGPRVHDARIYAICLEQGVRALWSADRDFSRFKGLRVINPLLET